MSMRSHQIISVLLPQTWKAVSNSSTKCAPAAAIFALFICNLVPTRHWNFASGILQIFVSSEQQGTSSQNYQLFLGQIPKCFFVCLFFQSRKSVKCGISRVSSSLGTTIFSHHLTTNKTQRLSFNDCMLHVFLEFHTFVNILCRIFLMHNHKFSTWRRLRQRKQEVPLKQNKGRIIVTTFDRLLVAKITHVEKQKLSL